MIKETPRLTESWTPFVLMLSCPPRMTVFFTTLSPTLMRPPPQC